MKLSDADQERVAAADAKVAAAEEALQTPAVESVSAITDKEINEGEELTLPTEVEVTLTNGEKAQKAVTWNTSAVDTIKPGEYTATGTVADTDKEATVKVVVKAVAPKVDSVDAVTTKSLKVKFSKAVDTATAKFEVKKGSIKVNTSAITWNADKTEATVELAGKLTAGEYTVNVTGLTETALTASTTVENEKVEVVNNSF